MATEKGQLTYYKWYFDKSRELEQMVNTGLLSLAQAAELFFAVQEYGEKGSKREMSTDSLKILFVSYCGDVDRAKGKYQDKVNKLAENGAKGGRAKAAKAAAAKEEPGAGSDPEAPKFPKFKPPTKAEFTTAARRIADSLGYEYDQYNTDCLYDKLKEHGWLVSYETDEDIIVFQHRIFSREDWETMISCELYDGPFMDDIDFYNRFMDCSPDGEPLGRFNSLLQEFKYNIMKDLSNDKHLIEGIRKNSFDMDISRFLSPKWDDFLKQHYGDREEDDTD